MTAAASSSTSTPVTPSRQVHLLVACHGLWGQPLHLQYLIEKLVKAHDGEISPTGAEPEEDDDDPSGESTPTPAPSVTVHEDEPQLVALITASNEETKTYDGIDWCSERIVREIDREMKRLKRQNRKVVRFSIFGYSLGGLMARYTIGLLHARGFFDEIEPVNFTTFATPHVGITKTTGWFAKLAEFVGGRLLGRTGAQIYVRDSGWEAPGGDQELSKSKSASKTKTTLLEAMSRRDSRFVAAILRFKHIDLYANAVSDITVPIRTGALMSLDPWRAWPDGGELDMAGEGIKITRHDKYPALLTSVEIPKEKPAKKPLLFRMYRSVVPYSLPWFLNPRHVPWRFPFNYLLVLMFPIAAPLLITLLIIRLWGGTRESNRRVKQLQAEWLQGREVLDTNEDGAKKGRGSKYTAEHERHRILDLVAETARAMGEDYVEEDSKKPPVAAELYKNGNARAKSSPSPPRSSTFVNHFDVTPESANFIDGRQPRLSAVQVQMQSNLHDALVPAGLRKHLAFFEGVRNSHAIIICRTPSMELHRRGKSVVRHFVDHFEV